MPTPFQASAIQPAPSLDQILWQNQYFISMIVRQSGFMLYNVPKEFHTPNLHELAVQQNVSNFYYVPEEKRTAAIYKLAVKQRGLFLGYVPADLITEELCQLATETDYLRIGELINSLPEPLHTQAKAKMRPYKPEYNYSRALSYLPARLLKLKQCQLAVQREGGRALEFIPEHLRTRELCELAMKQDSRAFAFVPKEKRTPELCLLAVKQDGYVLEDVPKEYFQDRDFCLAMVKTCGIALAQAPAHLIDQSFFDTILDHYRKLYFQENNMFSSYNRSSFFSEYQTLEEQCEQKATISSLVTFRFQ